MPELITGDVVTLTVSVKELEQKARSDSQALVATAEKLTSAPHIVKALKSYEDKTDDESMFVYWIDKMVTIPTHFYDGGANLRKLGIHNQQDIQQWYERTLAKLQKQKQKPHTSAVTILELAYKKMHDELVNA